MLQVFRDASQASAGEWWGSYNVSWSAWFTSQIWLSFIKVIPYRTFLKTFAHPNTWGTASSCGRMAPVSSVWSLVHEDTGWESKLAAESCWGCVCFWAQWLWSTWRFHQALFLYPQMWLGNLRAIHSAFRNHCRQGDAYLSCASWHRNPAEQWLTLCQMLAILHCK